MTLMYLVHVTVTVTATQSESVTGSYVTRLEGTGKRIHLRETRQDDAPAVYEANVSRTKSRFLTYKEQQPTSLSKHL